MPVLLIRADASAKVGAGHVMRCLALAQAWRHAGGKAILATVRSDLDLSQAFREEEIEVANLTAAHPDATDAAEVLALAERTRPDWIAVDGYHFDAAYGRALRATGARLLRIDDHGISAPYEADVVLDPNVGATATAVPRGTRRLIGPRYALLRREFAEAPPAARGFTPRANRVLVTLGGAPDPALVASAIEALGQLRGVEGVVLAGGSTRASTPENVRVLDRAEDMRVLMEWCDVAVSAAGSTASELAALGVPALLIPTVGNQAPVAASLAHSGAALEIPRASALDPSSLAKAIEALLADPAHRQRLSGAGPTLVEKRGAAAVVAELLSDLLDLRPAAPTDAHAVWGLANDPDVRASSFRSAEIPWETHAEWFARRLADPSSPLYLAWDSGRPLGYVRFDATPEGPEIGVAVAPFARRRGIGTALILAGVRRWVRAGGTLPVHAWVRPENHASIRAFERAGFRFEGRSPRSGVEALHFTYHEKGI